MADDLTAIVQRMMDAGESEENIGAVIRQFQAQAPTAPRGAMSVSRVADPEGGLALADIAQESPTAAAAGALGGAALGGMAAIGPSAVAGGVLRAAMHPATIAATQAYRGYKRNGIPGALMGGAEGLAEGAGLNLLGRGVGALRTLAKGRGIAAVAQDAAPAATEAATANPETVAQTVEYLRQLAPHNPAVRKAAQSYEEGVMRYMRGGQ